MKKLIFYAVSFFIFLTCEKKKDPTPLPILKGFISESITLRITLKSNFSIFYANEKVSTIQQRDSIKEDGGLKIYTNNIVITDGLPNNYSVVSDLTNPVGGSSQTNRIEYSGKKVANGFEIIIPFSSTLVSYALIELNTDNQMVKYSDTKIVSTDNNGVKRETLRDSYIRYEYDSKGNVVKAFQKINGSNAETLIAEYTYDTNPNPYKPLLWFFRLAGFGGTGGLESNNNVIFSKNYQQGVLLTESTGVYMYDPVSKYPLTVTTSGKSYSPNSGVGTSKTTFKY